MPANTSKVDRSTKWGNPFKVGEIAVHPVSKKRLQVTSKEAAISLFALYLRTGNGTELAASARRELKGINLACWCKDGYACHADVLLQVANGPQEKRRAA
jgi:hypothetical protein